MSFSKYCEKCKMVTRHVSKEKLKSDEDVCLVCSRRNKELKNKINKSEGVENVK